MLVDRFFTLCSQHLPYFAIREGRIVYVVITWYCMSTFYWAIITIRLRGIICPPPLQPFQSGLASWKFHLWTAQSSMCNHASRSIKFHGDVSRHVRITWYLISLGIVCLFMHTLLQDFQCNTYMYFFIIITSYWTDSHLAVKNSYHVVSSNKWSCSLSMLQCIIPETFQSSISEWVLWHLL